MQQLRRQHYVSTLLLIAGLAVCLPAAANPPTKERLPLTLTGSDCSSKEAAITTALQAIPGVTGINFNRIPNHVLVDMTGGTISAADVVKRVNDAAASPQCKVEIIEGCISINMPSLSLAPHHSE